MSRPTGTAAAIWSIAPLAAVVAETVDSSFDWGSAAAGAGVGAAITLVLVALGAAFRSRGTGVYRRGGQPS